MSSLHNHPVEDDIISAFKTTQNQSWSMFNDKLGSTPVHDSKKKDVFRSENPIELSDEDIPVFGLVPRLEKLMLVSCNKCSMIVKRDCIHHHYNRRHNNSEDDNFSLERFILPTIKTNKHRKQKLTSIRKHSDKKINDDEDIDPIVQRIKTEFDQLEFERLTEINRANVNQENEMQYDDESEVNLAIESCNTNTNCGVFDWNLPPFTQNLMHFEDRNENDNTAVFEEDCYKLSSDDGEQHSNKFLSVIDNENINYITNSSKLLTKSLDSNRKIKPNIVVDFSGIMSDDDIIYDEDPNDEYYHLPSRYMSYKEQTKLSTDDMDSDIVSNNDVLSDDMATTNHQSSILPTCVEEKTKLTPSESSESENDECSNNVTTNIDQITMVPVDDNKETQLIPCNKFSNVTNNENSMNTIEAHQCKVNDDLQNDNSGSSSNEEQTNCTPSSLECFDKTSNKNLSSCTINIHQTSITLSNINKEYQSLDKPLEIKEEYQPSNVPLDIKEEYQLPLIPLDIKEECQSPLIPQDFTEEYQLPHIPLDIKEEYQPSQSRLSVKEEFSVTTNTTCVDFLLNEINDSSKIVNWHSPSEPLNNEKEITGVPNCEYLTATSSDSSSNSITSDEQSYTASLEEYQLPVEPLHVKEKIQIISSPQYSNLGGDEKEKHKSNDVSKVTPPEADTLHSETKLLSSNTNVYAEFMNKNYTDSVFANISSSLPPLNVQEEIQFSPRNKFTVYNENSESTDDCSTSDYQSTTKLQDSKELKSSLTCNYSNNLDSNVSINKYYLSSIRYHRNAALIPLSPSFTSDEEVYESAEEYKNSSYQLSPKVSNSYDDTSSDEYSNDVNNIISDESFASYDQSSASLSNRENSKDILMVDILDDTMDNKNSKNIEDKYCLSSTESLDNEIQSPKCSNSMSCNSSNSSSVTSYDEVSLSLLGTGSNCSSKVESQSNSSSDESSNDSFSSTDQFTAPSSDTIKKTKSTQTNVCFSQKKHKKLVIPSIRIDESIAESLSVVNDLNKIAQTDESVFCEDCRRVSADLVEYYYPSNTRIEVDADIFFKDFYSGSSNAHIADNSVNNSNTKTTGHLVNSCLPVNSSAPTVNNANIPIGADQFELNNSDDYDRHINNCLLRLKQFSWDPNNPTRQNSVIENDSQLEDSDNISDFDLYADSQNDNVLYRTLMSGSTVFVDKNHERCNERLKKNIAEKMAYAENCKYVPSLNANIGTKVKKSLKRRLGGQVADDKENREKNRRWITGSFKKLKRFEFVNRKYSCSDESDNNVDE